MVYGLKASSCDPLSLDKGPSKVGEQDLAHGLSIENPFSNPQSLASALSSGIPNSEISRSPHCQGCSQESFSCGWCAAFGYLQEITKFLTN